VGAGAPHLRRDQIATEEPLEIRVTAGLQERGGAVPVFRRRGQAKSQRTVAITMRTPGADFELAAGFLFSEGVIAARQDVRRIRYCVDRDVGEDQRYNVVTVDLARASLPGLEVLERHFATTSACGVCGKASLDALQVRARPVTAVASVRADVLYGLPGAMRKAQGVFASTGGLHAAALFATDGELVALREDVGRHNAVDKLVGWALMEHRMPLDSYTLMVSGRSSYEIVQKAVTAGIPVVCAVSAPSSLAVDVARAFGVTLIGFLRERRFNVYAGHERVLVASG